jgi:putative FmdB family regulatory protein
MPTYEYRCKACGQHLEVVQSFTDDALTECPSCEGELRKVFGSIGIAFKGSGFYRNDSRSSSKSAASSSASSSGNGSDSKPDSKSDKSDKSESTSSSGSSSSSDSSSSSATSGDAKKSA